jgi:hypothetical protein
MPILFLLLPLLFTVAAQARLGETPIQFADRYASPKNPQSTRMTDATHPLVAGAIHHTYEYQGWKIRAAFLQLDSGAVRMEFQKLSRPGVSHTIQDYELQAIAGANLPAGMAWKQVFYNDPSSTQTGLGKVIEPFFRDAIGERMWQRTDGAFLRLPAGKMNVVLELPAARQHEAQLKVAREQKARAAVPQF